MQNYVICYKRILPAEIAGKLKANFKELMIPVYKLHKILSTDEKPWLIVADDTDRKPSGF